MKTKKPFKAQHCPDHPDKLINAGKKHPKRCKCKKAHKIRMEHTVGAAEKKRAIRDIDQNPRDKGEAASRKYLEGRNATRAKFYIQARTNYLAKLAKEEEARKKRENKVTEQLFEGQSLEELINEGFAQKLIEAMGGIPVINKSGNLKVMVPTKTARAKNPTKLVSPEEARKLGKGS